MKLTRRSLLAASAAHGFALTGIIGAASAQARKSVRIGYVVSKTGVNAAGAGTATIPNYELWALDVQEAGGLTMPDGAKLPLEIIAYDDRSQTEGVVRGVERLAQQDEVDFILPPWGTGFNLAAAPLMARFGYPQLAGTALVPQVDKIRERWPYSFWLLGAAEAYVADFVKVLIPATDRGILNGKVSMLSIADGFGIELAQTARPAFEEAGLEIVMDKTYPLGTKDFATLLQEAAASGADIFVAYSYPEDTFAITKQAQLAEYNPKVFYTGVGSSFAIYPQLNDGNVEGIMGLGGIDSAGTAVQGYTARFKEVIGQSPESWASPVIYASLQMLAQAIERRGVDREAVSKELATGKFDTILGETRIEENQFKNLWHVGQWRDGHFVAVSPPEKTGAVVPIIPKPKWR